MRSENGYVRRVSSRSGVPLRIVVSGIPRPGLQVGLDLGAAWVRAAAEGALGVAPASLAGQLEVLARGTRVNTTGWVETAWHGQCDRCGEPLDRALRVDLDLGWVPERDDHGSEVELGEDELDLGWYRDGELDLADVVREALALELPARLTCEDTSGCDARTEALLQRQADASRADSAFAALRSLH